MAKPTQPKGYRGVLLLGLAITLLLWLGFSALAPNPNQSGPMKDPLLQMNHTGQTQNAPSVNIAPTRTKIVLPSKGHSLKVELWDESALRRVGRGTVRIRKGGSMEGEVLAEVSASVKGIALFENLEAGQVQLEADALGYFLSDPLFVEIPITKKLIRLEMKVAALFLGKVVNREGDPVSKGWVRFTNTLSGEVWHTRPTPRGGLSSAPLPGGVYQIQWVKEERSPAPLGSGQKIAAAPGDRVEITVRAIL
ncbi:MAG: hypothetical protein OTJ44_00285 [Planctomycetota bacterium]|nr:hypothetical protein [Planctomycetota bacterium]